MSENIEPPNAARLWVSGNILHVSLPDGAVSHTLRLPNNTWGLQQVISILSSRHEDSKLGTPGDLTQYQAEAEMKALAKGFDPAKVKRKVKYPAEALASARNILRRMGI